MNLESLKEMSMTERINAAFRLVAKEVIETAKRTNTEIIIWRNGEIVRLSPEQALAEEAIDPGERPSS